MLDRTDARRLADALRAAGITDDEVAARLGTEALDGLARNATLPADRALAGADDPQALLIRCFALQQPVPTAGTGPLGPRAVRRMKSKILWFPGLRHVVKEVHAVGDCGGMVDPRWRKVPVSASFL